MASPFRLFLGLTMALGPAAWPAQGQSRTGARPQPDSAARRAAETITTEDFRAKLHALAHDSTRGRETPSPELAKATAWVAARFKAAGLSPAGDAGTYFQQFDIVQAAVDSLTTVTASQDGHPTAWSYGHDILYAVGAAPSTVREAPVVLLVGLPADTARPFGDVSMRGVVLLQVLTPDQLNGRVLDPMHRWADAAGVVAHLVASDIPDELWEQLRQGAFVDRWEAIGAASRDATRMAVYGLRLNAAAALLAANGEDPAALATPTARPARLLAGLTISIVPHRTVMQRATVANVVGVLHGSDPALRDEAVVFTSHLDHVGVIPGRCRPSRTLPADSICNGADDNASGTVGILELAEAFASLDPRPARTLVFAAMTAEERGLLGSRYYVEHPRVPLARTAAVINLDMIARNPPDTVGLVGKDYTSLGGMVAAALGAHPELHLACAEHEGVYGASDHYPFAQRGVPALFFFSGLHADLHTAADNPERVDVDQAARIVRLAFYVGLAAANSAERPVWDVAARERVVMP